MQSRRRGSEEAVRRVALVSGYPPSTATGGGIILRRLLAGLESELVVACSAVAQEAGRGLLACEHRCFRPWTAPRFARRAVRILNVLRTPFIALRLVRHVRGRTVLLVPWAGSLGAELFLAGWMAAVLARCRFVIYELDDWDASLDTHQARLIQVVGHALHARLLRGAAVTLAISPPLADRLKACHGVDVEVLASALDPVPPRAETSPTIGTPSIVFIGAIYGAQADAIARVLRSLALLSRPVDLRVYTAADEGELAEYEIAGPCLRLESPVANEGVLDVLRAATVLLLPASFRADQRQTVTTSLPTKTAEYLWSGVPVLVHGPPDSVIAQLARAEGWGLVADSEDERALAGSVEAILDDDDLRANLAQRARIIAEARHDLGRARRRMRSVLGDREWG